MARKLSERQWAILLVGILVAAIAGLYATTLAIQPPEVPPAVVRSVHLVIEEPGWSIRYDPASTTNNSAFSLLIEASSRLDFPVRYLTFQIPQGVFVTEINGSANGEGDRYWQYWVNGVYADLAADRTGLHNDDVVLWRFAIPQEGG